MPFSLSLSTYKSICRPKKVIFLFSLSLFLTVPLIIETWLTRRRYEIMHQNKTEEKIPLINNNLHVIFLVIVEVDHWPRWAYMVKQALLLRWSCRHEVGLRLRICHDKNESIFNRLRYANEIVEDLKHQYYPITVPNKAERVCGREVVRLTSGLAVYGTWR